MMRGHRCVHGIWKWEYVDPCIKCWLLSLIDKPKRRIKRRK